jgi:hypothetical protein
MKHKNAFCHGEQNELLHCPPRASRTCRRCGGETAATATERLARPSAEKL